jgi:hypothetical protein
VPARVPEGEDVASTYLPVFRRQIGDPTTDLDKFICTLVSGAMALDFQTLGRVRRHGGELVPHCGKSPAAIRGEVPGTKAGTNLGHVEQAWRHFGETLVRRTRRLWVDAQRDLDEGRAVVLQGDYDQLSLRTRCQANFTDDHAILLLPQRTVGHTLVGDPLCTTFNFWPDAELRAYAEKLGRRGHGVLTPQPIFYAATRPQIDIPDTSTEAAVDPVRHLPVAIADIGPGTVYADPDRRSILIPSWGGARNVGLYALPASPTVGGRPALAAIRLDLVGPTGDDLRIAWVGVDLVSNVRVAPGGS